jgi:hypothetical protein
MTRGMTRGMTSHSGLTVRPLAYPPRPEHEHPERLDAP